MTHGEPTIPLEVRLPASKYAALADKAGVEEKSMNLLANEAIDLLLAKKSLLDRVWERLK